MVWHGMTLAIRYGKGMGLWIYWYDSGG